MTSTLDRPPLRVPVRRTERAASPVVPGLVAAAWATGAGLVTLGLPVLLAWATDSRSGSGAAAATRAIGQLWLLAHGTALSVPGGAVGLTPLGLTMLPLVLLHRAGRHAARSLEVASLAEAGRLAGAVAVPYAVGCAVVAAVSSTSQVRPAPVQAVLAGLAVALLGAGSGVLRQSRQLVPGWRLLPQPARRLLVGTTAAAAALLAGGSLLVAVALVQHAGRATSLAAASDPGLVGGLVLFASGLACVPNAALWGAAWLAGPGFAVGVGTGVSPFRAALGEVPAVPLLAALPSSPLPTWLGVVCLAVPIGAGVLGGLVLARRLTCTAGRAALEGLALGPCAGVVLGGLAWLSGGPLGGGRLTDVGPSPWQVALAVTAEVGVGAAAAAAFLRRH